MSVKCTAWTKEASSASMSVSTSLARTTAPAPMATSCSQMGEAVKVSDRRKKRTKTYSQGPGSIFRRVCSPKEKYLDLEKAGAFLSRDFGSSRGVCQPICTCTPEAYDACQGKEWPHPFPAEGIFRTWETKLKNQINNLCTPCSGCGNQEAERQSGKSLSFFLLHASAVLSSRCGRVFEPAAQLQPRHNLYQHGGRLPVCQPWVSTLSRQHQLRQDISLVSCSKHNLMQLVLYF